MSSPSGPANPWHWIVDDRTLSPNEKLVALTIVRHANREARCRVRIARIATLSNLCERSVRNAIAALRGRPWFTMKRTGRSSIFAIDPRGAAQANLFSNAHVGLWKKPMESSAKPVDMKFAMGTTCRSDRHQVPIHRSRVLEAGKANPPPLRSGDTHPAGPDENRIAALEWELRQAHKLLRVKREDRDEDLRRELAAGTGPRG